MFCVPLISLQQTHHTQIHRILNRLVRIVKRHKALKKIQIATKTSCGHCVYVCIECVYIKKK